MRLCRALVAKGSRIADAGVTFVVTAALVIGAVPRVWAHAEPEKVVEDRFVVSLVPVPEADAMKLRFSFRDLRSGGPLTEAITYRVRIREAAAPKVLYESPELHTTTGVADLRYTFGRDGFYEAFLEFRRAAEPGRVYRPDDWSLWLPASRGRASGVGAIAGTAAALAVVSASLWRWTAVRGRRRSPPSASMSSTST